MKGAPLSRDSSALAMLKPISGLSNNLSIPLKNVQTRSQPAKRGGASMASYEPASLIMMNAMIIPRPL
ncbi:MAG: hypothetical protein H6Q30_1601 [Bacteroidetes bacterium]|nr:hypothetical protein [Bacteroidota bacterium]